MFHDRSFEDRQPLDTAPGERFDLLKEPRRVEDVVADMALVRQRFSTVELATLAAVALLDQYMSALVEIGLRWWKDPKLAIAGVYALIALLLPLLGFLAGIALDIAVFGGAAEALVKVSPIYAAFAAGSLVFAVGLGIAPDQYKRVLGFTMAIACFGASLIAADNPQFRAHFANALPWLKSEERQLERELAQRHGEIAGIDRAIANKNAQLYPPGLPPIMNDGTPDNDSVGLQLYTDITKLNADRVAVEKGASDLGTRIGQVRQDNPAQHIGRVVGALYIFCWLLASQIVIAVVIEMTAGKFREQRERSAELAFKRHFVRQLDGADPEKSRALVEAAILDILVRRFNPILTLAAANDAAKLECCTDLYLEEPLAEMREIGTEVVCKTLVQRRGNMLVRPRADR